MFLWVLTQKDTKYQAWVKGYNGNFRGDGVEKTSTGVGILGLLYCFSNLVDRVGLV